MSTQLIQVPIASAEGYNTTKSTDGTWRTREDFVTLDEFVNTFYGFTAQSFSGQTYHYILGNNNALGDGSVDVYIYDEEWVLISSALDIAEQYDPLAVWSHAITYGQIVVNSPGISKPLWGFIGSTLIAAERVDSISPDTPALDLFPGLVCSFADRICWTFNNQVYINDPGTEPRTITTPNAIGLAGKITDLFQAGSGGELIIVTTDGVYSLPPDGLAGFAFAGQISRSTHYRSLNPRNAASARGLVHGLTADGLMDLRSGEVIKLTVNRRPRKITRPFGPGRATDMRTGQMFAHERGYYISFGRGEPFCAVDLDTNSISWWDSQDYAGPLKGILRDYTGRPIFVLGEGILYLWGDTTPETAGLALEVTVPGVGSYLVREVIVTALGDGVTPVGAAVRKVERSIIPPAPPDAVLTTSSVWDAGELQEVEFRSRRMQFAERTDGIYFEISIGRDQKLQDVSVKTVTQSPARVTN